MHPHMAVATRRHATRFLTLAAGILATLSIGACADSPTEPTDASTARAANIEVQSLKKNGMQKPSRGGLTVPVNTTLSVAGIAHEVVGTIGITHIDVTETRDLLADGLFKGTIDGVAVTQYFTDVPLDLSRTAPATADAVIQSQHLGDNEIGVCDVLFLDIGPIHLDLLGVVLDVAPIVIDLDAQAGPGNLLGNLLCALLGLLDGAALLQAIIALLENINAILGSLIL